MPVYKDKERGTWFIKCYYTNWDGEKKQKKKRGFTTKKEALEWEHTFLSQEHSETTMSLQSLANLYLSDMGTRLRSSTMSTKQHIIELKILPFFQNKLVSEITPTDIRKWQNQMIAKGYSTTYLKLINTQLVAMLNYAVKYCNLRENPCHKAGTIGKSRAKEMQFWTKEEFYRFLACVENKPTSSEAFQILFWTGIRSGELLALTAEDLDFKAKTIRINKTYQRVHQEDIITEPKTPKSNRLVTIPDFLCRTLKVYVKQRKLQPQDRLFPYTKYYLHHEMDRGCKNSGVPRIRLHDLRHSHASLLIELNFSPLLISERLGHEKIETTLNIYSHLYPNKQAELARTLHSIGTKLNEENNKSVPN
jgi:integrase